MDAKLDCGAKDPKQLDSALQILESGIERFPRSARLVFLKGFVNGRLGESGVEQRYYLDALNLARANIAADPTGRSTADDRQIAKYAEANLIPAWRPAK